MSCKTIINENRAYWTKRAEGYSEVNREELRTDSRERWQSTLDDKIKSRFKNRNRENIKVLEVGTGPGFFAIILAELGYDVTAIDLTENMLNEAKHNAGALRDKINFIEMNAEELGFCDESFDVILSRNLTWNLPHPVNAYRDWSRVLKKDGLMLNFDANWYNYLFDEKAKEGYEQDREKSAELGIKDENVGENFDVMENIALRIPLSSKKRPAWDLAVLSELKLKTKAYEHIWQTVWSDEEKINFASTPMFLIEAVKTA